MGVVFMLEDDDARKQAHERALAIEKKFKSSATKGDRISDWVAQRVGSWNFIGMQSLLLGIWVLWNTLPIIPANFRFDKAPFIGMNLLLSFQAAYTAPFIMMSQNRSGIRDRTYAESDFETNAIAETEIDELHDHLEELLAGAKVYPVMMGHLETLLKRVEQLELQNKHLLEVLVVLEANSQSGSGTTVAPE
jgi:uncharacterized membrane protein